MPTVLCIYLVLFDSLLVVSTWFTSLCLLCRPRAGENPVYDDPLTMNNIDGWAASYTLKSGAISGTLAPSVVVGRTKTCAFSN